MAWKQFERIKESLDIPLNDHPTTLRIRIQLPPAWSQQVPQLYFIYHITSTHTHQCIIQIQHVDL